MQQAVLLETASVMPHCIKKLNKAFQLKKFIFNIEAQVLI